MPDTSPPVRGDIAQALRLARGHILRDVATDTGIHVTTLSLIEHGHRPGKPHMRALATFLRVPVDVLAGHRPALSTLREAARLTPDVLAAAAGIGVADLARYESGEAVPGPAVVRKLARKLGVKASTLTWSPPGEAAPAA